MAQPKIEGVGHGVPRMLYASDGSNWYAILVDSDGHVKIDVVDLAGLQNALDSVATDELDTHVEGFDPVPSTPVWQYAADTSIAQTSWTSILSVAVTTNKTWYITDLFFTPSTYTNSPTFVARLTIAGTEVWRRIYPAGYSDHVALRTPRKATTAQAVAVQIYMGTAGGLPFSGGFAGFEV